MGNDRLTKFVADATPGSRAIDAVFFSPNVAPNISTAGTIFTYNLKITGGPALIELTTDGGATWHSINNGVEIGANSTFTAQELIDFGETFNLRSKTPITLDSAIVRII